MQNNFYKNRRSLSPSLQFDISFSSRPSPKNEKVKKLFKRESHLRLPEIKRQYLNKSSLQMPFSPQNDLPIKPTYRYYYKVSRVQRENNALRDFITNFHLKKEGNRVASSLDELSNGATYAIVGKVQRYFNQLEDYIKQL